MATGRNVGLLFLLRRRLRRRCGVLFKWVAQATFRQSVSSHQAVNISVQTPSKFWFPPEENLQDHPWTNWKNCAEFSKQKFCQKMSKRCALLVVMLSTLVDVGHGLGSCKQAALCCNGRDSSCVVQKTAVNAIVEDLQDQPCYCDHACLKLNDCCPDYRQTCGGKRTASR